MVLGSCENVNTVVQLVTIPSRQLNCNTVFILLQELIAKGGDIHVDFQNVDYQEGPGPEPDKKKNQ